MAADSDSRIAWHRAQVKKHRDALKRVETSKFTIGKSANPKAVTQNVGHLDRFGRRLACLCVKSPAELTRAQVSGVGEVRDGNRLVQIVSRVGERQLDAIRFRRQFEQVGELRLPAAAAMVDNELARHGLGEVRPKIVLDERQTEVDSGGHAR